MKAGQLVRRLNAFGRHVEDTFPRINHGGCAVFAVAVAEHLRQKYPTSIAVGAAYYWTTPENIPSIDAARPKIVSDSMVDWNNNGVHFNHVIVEFKHGNKTYHFDTAGCIKAADMTKTGNYRLAKGRMTVVEAAWVAAEENGWNKSFDRAFIPQLLEMVDNFFATVH